VRADTASTLAAALVLALVLPLGPLGCSSQAAPAAAAHGPADEGSALGGAHPRRVDRPPRLQ